MKIEWSKLAIGAAVGFIGLSLLNKHKFMANQGFFGSGFSLPLSVDVPTQNCTPSAGYGSPATYCDRSGWECGQGVDCNSALIDYCRKYGRGPGGTCLTGPGGYSGPPLSMTPFPQGYGSAPQPSYGYGYNPYQQQGGYGYNYNPYQYQTPQYGGYGYNYPSYGYNPYQYNYNPYQYRRAYVVTGYDKRSGHFLYG